MFRLGKIDAELRNGRHPNAATLAREIEVSARTIHRDLEYMRDVLGAPIEYDAEAGGYRYGDDGYRLPPISLTDSDLLGLLVAGEALRAYSGTPFEADLRKAFERLAAVLPHAATVHLTELARATTFSFSAPREQDVRTFERLTDAVRRRATLRIRYASLSTGAVRWRRVDPYRLLSLDGAWYLIAYCHSRKDVRTFVPTRIEALEATGKFFQPPADFDLEAYLAGAFRILRGDRPQRIRLKFHGMIARYVAERRWHPTQAVKPADDGCILEFVAANLDEVVRFVLSFGSDCEVLAPEILRARVVEALSATLRVYGKRRPRPHPDRPRRRTRARADAEMVAASPGPRG
jgi:predicted DNA-binding transcriptional regulator YafY